MVLFLLVALFYTIESTQDASKVTTAAQGLIKTEQELCKKIKEKFKVLIEEKRLEISCHPITVTFVHPDYQFQSGSADLPAAFRSTLQEFFPKLLDIVHQRNKYIHAIEELRVEGHTSSERFSKKRKPGFILSKRPVKRYQGLPAIYMRDKFVRDKFISLFDKEKYEEINKLKAKGPNGKFIRYSIIKTGLSASEIDKFYDHIFPMEAFKYNMWLSQHRARAVVEYCLGLYPISGTQKKDRDLYKAREKWAYSNLTANGLSYARPKRDKKNEFRENKPASRRVEFKLITNTRDIIRGINSGQKHAKSGLGITAQETKPMSPDVPMSRQTEGILNDIRKWSEGKNVR